MNNDMRARKGVPDQAGRSSARRVIWIPRAVTVGLLTVATVMGVHLGLAAPDVSPVSPPAIAALYGLPPAPAPAAPPAEVVAMLPAALPAAPAADTSATAAASPAAPPATASTTDALAAARANTTTSTQGVDASTQQVHQHGQRNGGNHD